VHHCVLPAESESRETTVKVWDTRLGSVTATLDCGQTFRIKLTAFSRDGLRLASASNDKQVVVWRIPDATIDATLRGHKEVISSLYFSNDGTLLISTDYSCEVLLWNLATASVIAVFEGSSAKISPNNRTIVTCRAGVTSVYHHNGDSDCWQLTSMFRLSRHGLSLQRALVSGVIASPADTLVMKQHGATKSASESSASRVVNTITGASRHSKLVAEASSVDDGRSLVVVDCWEMYSCVMS
jgi:WD40 repeat protein